MSRVFSADDRAVTVHIPWKLKKRGGRKLVICPDGTSTAAKPIERIDSAMVKALARAFRWRKLLEAGFYGSAGELAAAEGVDPSLSRSGPATDPAGAGSRRGDTG